AEFMWCKNNQFIIIHIERESNNYKEYDIDKHVIENKIKSDYHFSNNENGIDSFKRFFEEVLLNGL
ncbi:adenylate kinase, partial [Salmonella enterica subsp. enterica]|nr:adenylate kinase [Salmonella enterica subsp. enterica]